MDEKAKRPILVWVISIYFILSGLWGLVNLYGISTGAIELPEGMTAPSGIFHYIKVIAAAACLLLSAILLFFRQEIAKWFFLGYLIYSIISGLYSFVFSTLPGILEENKTMYFGFIVISWIIFALIVRYTFKLKEKNYYAVAEST